jgi:hypothetical protein
MKVFCVILLLHPPLPLAFGFLLLRLRPVNVLDAFSVLPNTVEFKKASQ